MDSPAPPPRICCKTDEDENDEEEGDDDQEPLTAAHYPRSSQSFATETEAKDDDTEDHRRSHYDDNNHVDQDLQPQLPLPLEVEKQVVSLSLAPPFHPQESDQILDDNKTCCKSKKDDDTDSGDDDDDSETLDQVPLTRARDSQVIRPGAVAVRGISFLRRSISSTSLDEIDEYPQESSSVIYSGPYSTVSTDHVLVVPDEDVEGPDEESEARRHRQDVEQAEEFAAQVREAILQHTVQAEVVVEEKPQKLRSNLMKKRRALWMICVTAAVAAVVVAIVIPIVVVTEARRRHKQPHNLPTANNITYNSTTAPSMSPAPVFYCLYCLNLTTNLTSDFSNATNLTVFEQLEGAINHTRLPEFLAFTGLQRYAVSTNITLFAPVDESFEDLPLPYAYYQSNFYWIYHLVALLNYHIVAIPLNITEIFNMKQLPTLAGPDVAVHVTDMTIGEDMAKILLTDIPAANGYIHVPDRVLLPTDLRQSIWETADALFASNSNFSIFGHLYNLSGLENTLSQYYFANGLTLLIPTNDAFQKMDAGFVDQLSSNLTLTRDFISYHLVPINAYQEVIVTIVKQIDFFSLDRLTLWFTATNADYPTAAYANTAQIQYSIYSKDGLLHIVDEVLVPPNIGEMLLITTNVTIYPPYDFALFVDLAKGPARLESLFFADTMSESDSSPFTVFAPDKFAFDEADAISHMLHDSSHWSQWWLHVQNLILHHCIAKEIHNSDLLVGTLDLEMLSGYSIFLQVSTEGNVTNDDLDSLNLLDGAYYAYPNFTIDGVANVTLNNLIAVNGIVYGIDSLLLPPWASMNIYETVASRPEFSKLVSLITAANLTSLLHDTTTQGLTLLAPNNTALSVVDTTNITEVRDLVFSHILLGNVYFADFNTTSVKSFNQKKYGVRVVGDQIEVAGSFVINPDVLASNGVVQEIDRLLT